MSLLQEILRRTPAERLVQLTQAGNPGGLKNPPNLAGTVALVNGSTAVVGAGTTFTGFGTSIIVQFASHPGVSYVVAAIVDATHLTLVQPYGGVTTASTTAVLPSINYDVLQQACYDAMARFQARTNYPFDDVTANAGAATAILTLNKTIYAGIALVIAFLYENGRGYPWPDAEVANAWRLADDRLREILHVFGDGALGLPVTDSNFTPSPGPSGLPAFDNARFTDLTQRGPGGGASGGQPSEWN